MQTKKGRCAALNSTSMHSYMHWYLKNYGNGNICSNNIISAHCLCCSFDFVKRLQFHKYQWLISFSCYFSFTWIQASCKDWKQPMIQVKIKKIKVKVTCLTLLTCWGKIAADNFKIPRVIIIFIANVIIESVPFIRTTIA